MRDNRFLFLAVKINSEANSETLWHAENQVAANLMHWLLEQAHSGETYPTTDSIAFTTALTHRQVLVHVHHYAEEDHRFYMSYLKSFSPTDPADVQGCHDIIKTF